MNATISFPAAVRAAAMVSNRGYLGSVFQVVRSGSRAKVVGANGGSVIEVAVDAGFRRWPDGARLTMGSESIRSMMRGIGRSLPHARSVSFEVSGDKVSVSLEADGAVIGTALDMSGDACFGTRRDVFWPQTLGTEGDYVSPVHLGIACAAMGRLGFKSPARVSKLDGYPLTMAAESDLVQAVAMVSRCR